MRRTRIMLKPEQRLLQGIVKTLAQEQGTPLLIVEKMLRAEVVELERCARIKQFVPLLTAKRVKERLRPAPRAG